MYGLSRKQSFVWGGLLIVFGIMGLLESISELSPWVWAGVLAVSGAGVLAIYLTDRSEWGFLITTYALWAVALLIALVEWDILPDPFIAIYVLAAIALPFLVVYVRNRENWWALIPAYVLLAIAVMIGLTEWHILPDTFIATYVLLAIALPFVVVFLRDHNSWWALIPAYVLIAVGVMVALIDTGVLGDLMVPAYVMFAIAIPFFVVYIRNPREWWPLIPGGIMAVIGSAFVLSAGAAQSLGAVVLIGVGVLILLRQFLHPKSADEAMKQE
ncbi:MAG TPA: hypothetical protein PKZ84_08985 [Anaerolineae bacterium]|nr:hypothetical protein [Anaerolineae bacterium]HQI84603.1 hypothetical protein [Anaerolineae bacterium]